MSVESTGNEPALPQDQLSLAPMLGSWHGEVLRMASPHKSVVENARQKLKRMAIVELGTNSFYSLLHTTRNLKVKSTLAYMFSEYGRDLVDEDIDREFIVAGLMDIFYLDDPRFIPNKAMSSVMIMRRNALCGAWNISPEMSLPHVLNSLSHKDFNIRLAATNLLTESEMTGLDDVLLGSLAKAEQHSLKGHYAALTLAKRGRKEGVDVLMSNLGLDSEYTAARQYAINETLTALLKFGPDILPNLLDILRVEEKPKDMDIKTFITERRNVTDLVMKIVAYSRGLGGVCEIDEINPEWHLTQTQKIEIKTIMLKFLETEDKNLDFKAAHCLSFLDIDQEEISEAVCKTLVRRSRQGVRDWSLLHDLRRIGNRGLPYLVDIRDDLNTDTRRTVIQMIDKFRKELGKW